MLENENRLMHHLIQASTLLDLIPPLTPLAKKIRSERRCTPGKKTFTIHHRAKDDVINYGVGKLKARVSRVPNLVWRRREVHLNLSSLVWTFAFIEQSNATYGCVLGMKVYQKSDDG